MYFGVGKVRAVRDSKYAIRTFYFYEQRVVDYDCIVINNRIDTDAVDNVGTIKMKIWNIDKSF